MAFQPCPNIASVEMVYDWNGQVVENVFHVKGDTDFTEGMCEDTAQAFYGWWQDNLRAQQHTSASLLRVVVKGLHAAVAPQWTVSCVSGCAGQATGDSTPNNVTAAISWLTGLTGRSSRGRSYHVGLTETAYTGNTLVTSVRDALAAIYEELFAVLGTLDEGIHLVVLSRFHAGAPRTNGIGTAITGLAIDLFVDSMRRRLAGRGQ